MSILNAITSGAGGVALSGDTSGNLIIQSAGVNVATFTSTGMVTNVGAPTFSAYAGAGTSLSNGAFTKIAFNTESFDIGSCYNNTGSTVTLNGISTPSYSFAPNVAGYYIITANCYVGAVGGSTNTTCGIYKNGGAYGFGSGSSSTSNTYFTVSHVVYLNGTSDYVSFQLYWTGAGSSTDSGSAYIFTGSMLRSA